MLNLDRMILFTTERGVRRHDLGNRPGWIFSNFGLGAAGVKGVCRSRIAAITAKANSRPPPAPYLLIFARALKMKFE
jgi:hypothetical protein